MAEVAFFAILFAILALASGLAVILGCILSAGLEIVTGYSDRYRR